VILDSSAIVAIMLDEPERRALIDLIDTADLVAVGAPTLVESGVVLTARRGERAVEALVEVLYEAGVSVIEFGVAHWQEALRAWMTYGRGRHPARLNLGDCMAYATARVAGRPLLAKGGDFAMTDLELAWRPG
jgi:ribonuclease VapC